MIGDSFSINSFRSLDTSRTRARASEAQVQDLVDLSRAGPLKEIADTSQLSGAGLGKATLQQAIHTGLTISSSILGGPAGAALQLFEQDGKVQARLGDQEANVVDDKRIIGTVRVELPGGRKAEVNKYESTGLSLYVTDPEDNHRRDVNFGQEGHVESTGTFVDRGGPESSAGVRYNAENEQLSIIINEPRSVHKYASPHGLSASQTMYHHSQSGMIMMNSHDLPEPSVGELAQARDQALGRLQQD